jgi:hypothetical protein
MTTGTLECSLHLLLGVSVHYTCVRGEVGVQRVLVGDWRRRHRVCVCVCVVMLRINVRGSRRHCDLWRRAIGYIIVACV